MHEDQSGFLPTGGAPNHARRTGTDRRELEMSYGSRERKRRTRAAQGSAGREARRLGSSAAKWWLTPVRSAVACATCGSVLRPGADMIYRHAPREPARASGDRQIELGDRLSGAVVLVPSSASDHEPRDSPSWQRRSAGLHGHAKGWTWSVAATRCGWSGISLTSARQDRHQRSLLGTTKRWPCMSNPVRLSSYVSRATGASGDCGLSAGVLAAGPVETP